VTMTKKVKKKRNPIFYLLHLDHNNYYYYYCYCYYEDDELYGCVGSFYSSNWIAVAVVVGDIVIVLVVVVVVVVVWRHIVWIVEVGIHSCYYCYYCYHCYYAWYYDDCGGYCVDVANDDYWTDYVLVLMWMMMV